MVPVRHQIVLTRLNFIFRKILLDFLEILKQTTIMVSITACLFVQNFHPSLEIQELKWQNLHKIISIELEQNIFAIELLHNR
jgi:hypothetical protein